MPILRSSKKALRVSVRRKKENSQRTIAYKSALKNLRKSLTAGKDDSEKLLAKAQSSIDKAAKNHIIHPNKASRLKSRITKISPAESKKSVGKDKVKSQIKTKKK